MFDATRCHGHRPLLHAGSAARSVLSFARKRRNTFVPSGLDRTCHWVYLVSNGPDSDQRAM